MPKHDPRHSKPPRNRYARTRLTEAEHKALEEERHSRNVTVSGFIRAVVVAHLSGQRAQLPHHNRSAALLRELSRIGNNLNQLTHRANTGQVPVSAEEVRTCLAAINNLARTCD